MAADETTEMTQTTGSTGTTRTTGATETTGTVEARGPWQLAWQRLRRDKVAMTCAVVIVLILLMAVFAPLATAITGHPPNTQYRETGLTADGLPKPPSGEFW